VTFAPRWDQIADRWQVYTERVGGTKSPRSWSKMLNY